MSVPITTLAARSTMSLLYALVPPRFHRFARLRSGLLIRCKFRPVPWSGRDHEEASTDGAKPVSEPQSFPIEKIHVPEKKRKALKPEIVEDIAESILDVGQQDAILVRREKDHFVLVEGLHRLEACKALGERAILCVLISAEAARQRDLPPPPVDPEREKPRNGRHNP